MPAKNPDSRGRSRARIIGFRVSPKEDRLIHSAVALTKQPNAPLIHMWGVALYNIPFIFSYLSHFIIDLKANVWYNIDWKFVLQNR